MTILKDFFCTGCGAEIHDVEVASCSVSSLRFVCEDCHEQTEHKAMCNGGRNSRFRFFDWNSDDVASRINVTKSGCCYGNTTDGAPDYSQPVKDNKTGIVYQDRSKHSPEALREKRAVLDHTRAAQRGRGKITTTARARPRAAKGAA